MYETTFRTIDLRPGTVQEALEWQPPGPGTQPDSDSSEAEFETDEEDFESLERAAAESSSAGSESLGLAEWAAASSSAAASEWEVVSGAPGTSGSWVALSSRMASECEDET